MLYTYINRFVISYVIIIFVLLLLFCYLCKCNIDVSLKPFYFYINKKKLFKANLFNHHTIFVTVHLLLIITLKERRGSVILVLICNDN